MLGFIHEDRQSSEVRPPNGFCTVPSTVRKADLDKNLTLGWNLFLCAIILSPAFVSLRQYFIK
jgi:hypothetical protein